MWSFTAGSRQLQLMSADFFSNFLLLGNGSAGIVGRGNIAYCKERGDIASRLENILASVLRLRFILVCAKAGSVRAWHVDWPPQSADKSRHAALDAILFLWSRDPTL
ncbi:hypothetical protein J6590_053375 [Homalodisca vitripennis]|nr:hypothetical protein J6590_053375 [Homalodisca vitripennis]